MKFKERKYKYLTRAYREFIVKILWFYWMGLSAQQKTSLRPIMEDIIGLLGSDDFYISIENGTIYSITKKDADSEVKKKGKAPNEQQ